MTNDYDLETINDSLAKLLILLRSDASLEIHELAELLEVCPIEWENYELGVESIPAATLYRLGKHLGYSMNIFFVPLNRPELFIEEFK